MEIFLAFGTLYVSFCFLYPPFVFSVDYKIATETLIESIA